MTHHLAPGLHAAPLGDQVILLDVPANRYRLLSGRSAAAVTALETGAAPADNDFLLALERSGIVMRNCRRDVRQHPARATASAFDRPDRAGASLPLPRVTFAVLRTMSRLRWSGFAAALGDVQRLKARQALATNEAAAIALAQAFRRARGSIPIPRICLRDSLALFRLMAKAGLDCDVVLGVRLDPFGAHSWIQCGGVLLSDDLDTVAAFHPILTL